MSILNFQVKVFIRSFKTLIIHKILLLKMINEKVEEKLYEKNQLNIKIFYINFK
jgi:hypothetical protein